MLTESKLAWVNFFAMQNLIYLSFNIVWTLNYVWFLESFRKNTRKRKQRGKWKEIKKWRKIKNKVKFYKLFLYTTLSSFNLFNSIIYRLKNINIYKKKLLILIIFYFFLWFLMIKSNMFSDSSFTFLSTFE